MVACPVVVAVRTFGTLLWVVFGLGCEGTIFEPGAGPGGGGRGGPGALVDQPAPTTRVARLSHAQWDNSVRDLLRLEEDVTFADGFRPDPNVAGFTFENNALSMQVDQSLWSQYQRGAAEAASFVTSDPARLERISPVGAGDDAARARALVVELGQRAHRRPLDDGQIDAYLAVYQAGRALYGPTPSFESGARLLIEALLQSPHFVYRVEQSTERARSVIPLDDWEVATRLSYVLWNTMPDDELFAAAAAGELSDPDQVGAHAVRMLLDPSAADVVADFHRQLLEVRKYESISPSAAFFPDAPANLARLAIDESDLFVRHVFEGGDGLIEILTSTETFVNDELAPIYGLTASHGPDLVRVDLDPTRRRGIFTQVGFLASNATSVDPDPIHRGVFLTERIACNHIGAPPGMIPPLPPPMGRTNRETVEEHTQAEGSVCASCHTVLINPFGFPYENYDAVGRWRDEDNGFPVDATGAPLIGGDNVPVDGALALADALARSEAVHACYAKHWLEYGLGRPEDEAGYDDGIVAQLGELSHGGASLRDLLSALVTSRAFLTRSTEELP